MYGTQFAQERKQAGLSQRDVAEALGMDTAQYISNIERGKCRLAAAHYRRLPKLFGRAATERIIDAALKEDRERYYALLPK